MDENIEAEATGIPPEEMAPEGIPEGAATRIERASSVSGLIPTDAGISSSDLPDMEEIGRVAGHAALSAAMAVSMSAALHEPPRTDLIKLNEPVPIVRVLEEPKTQEKPAEAPKAEIDENRESIRRLLRMLRFLVVALFLIAAMLFGLLRGCASCTAGVLAPPAEEEGSEEVVEVDQASVLLPVAESVV
ncbi:MAG: hypothetical protein IJH87_02590 [Atopobiaceae bacterium]|nr:hypothetical protein [Atopobiaceae bacterium]